MGKKYEYLPWPLVHRNKPKCCVAQEAKAILDNIFVKRVNFFTGLYGSIVGRPLTVVVLALDIFVVLLRELR